MDFVHLFNENSAYGAVVTDDLMGLINGGTGKFSIYLVFLKQFRIRQPLTLVPCGENEDVTELDAHTAFDRGTRTCNPRISGPDEVYEAGDVLKLEFATHPVAVLGFRSAMITDGVNRTERNSSRVTAVTCGPDFDSDKHSLHLLFPFPLNLNSVLVLSEKAYTAYVNSGRQPKTSQLTCPIDYRPPGTTFFSSVCGHLVCRQCRFKEPEEHQRENNTKKSCLFCCSPLDTDGYIRTKLRHGPCPYDRCAQNPDENNGVVLRPCGCYIACHALKDIVKRSPYGTDQSEILQNLSHCPYDACEAKIESLINMFCFTRPI